MEFTIREVKEVDETQRLYKCVKCSRIFSTSTDIEVLCIIAQKDIGCPKCGGKLEEYEVENREA